MKKLIIFFLILVFFSLTSMASVNIVPDYCENGDDCTIGSLIVGDLNVTGDFYTTNVTNLNMTGDLNVTGCVNFPDGSFMCGYDNVLGNITADWYNDVSWQVLDGEEGILDLEYLDYADEKVHVRFLNNISINGTLNASEDICLYNGICLDNVNTHIMDTNITVLINSGKGYGLITYDFQSLSLIQITTFPTSSNNNYSINVTGENTIDNIDDSGIIYTGDSILPYQINSPGSSYINVSFNNVTIDEDFIIRVRYIKWKNY